MILARKKRTGQPPLSTLPTGRAIVEELLASHPKGAPFDGPGLLAAHPELKNHRSALLQLAYEDFCRRDDLGMVESSTAFAARYPTISRSLLMQLGAHRLVDELDAVDDANWPVAGQSWLGYHLVEELGRGAFSRVYLAREPALGNRPVVVKVTSLGPNEACTLGMLRHPHIVPVHTVRWDDHLKKAAVCMAYVSRVTLFDVMDAMYSTDGQPARAAAVLETVRELNAVAGEPPEPMNVRPWPNRWQFCDALLQIGADVAQALRHAHGQGVLHGDVKPSNILITDCGSAVLLDFNLAIFGDESAPFLAGTLPYMAPEQLRPVIARGTARDVILDERTDVFSLGVTLFELAYGWYPFGNLPDDHDRQRSAGLLLERQKRGARLPDRRPAHVDRRLGEIILQCMAFEPGERPQSMDELLARLEGELKAVPRARRWLRSHRQLTATAATLACGAGLALGGWLATRDPYPIRELKNGQTALQTGNPAGAVKHFTAAFKTDPKLLEARFLRGCARYRDEDYLAAFADLEPLVEQLPDGRAAAALAHMHFQLRSDCHTAAAYYRKAAEQGCRTAAIYNNLAYCDMQTRVFDEAIEASKKASALNPELSSPYRLRILVAIQLTLHHRCVMDLPAIEEALQAHPESADLKSDAALYLFFAGRASDNEDFKRTAIDRTFDLLSEALDQGVPRTRLKPFLDADAELNGDPRWQALEARHASNVSSAREDLVIDPLDELTQPQSAAPTLPIRSHEPRTVSATSSR